MHALTLILVLVSAFLSIASGVWVATALVRAISAYRVEPPVGPHENEEDANADR